MLLGEVISGIRLAEARRAEVIDSLELETVRPEGGPDDFAHPRIWSYEPKRG
jgi:hypothetical protein